MTTQYTLSEIVRHFDLSQEADRAAAADLLLERDLLAYAWVAEEDSLPALANSGDADCYPTCTVRVLLADGRHFDVRGWKVYCTGRHYGGSDHLSWHTGDGAYRGHIHVEADDAEITIRGGDNLDFAISLSMAGAAGDAEVAELAEAIAQAIDAAYRGWTPGVPSDEEIVAVLRRRRAAETLSVEAEFDTAAEDEDENATEEFSVELYAGTHAGRKVFAVEGCDELFGDAEDAVAEARRQLAAKLEGAEYGIVYGPRAGDVVGLLDDVDDILARECPPQQLRRLARDLDRATE